MELILSKQAIKFVKKLAPKEQERIREKLASLLGSVEESGLIPSGELDIKTLEGEWKGCLRMRIGIAVLMLVKCIRVGAIRQFALRSVLHQIDNCYKVRILFTVDLEKDELQVYGIGFRGDIYKSSKIIYDHILRLT
jgi:mRNA interferase RelE/StbE